MYVPLTVTNVFPAWQVSPQFRTDHFLVVKLPLVKLLVSKFTVVKFPCSQITCGQTTVVNFPCGHITVVKRCVAKFPVVKLAHQLTMLRLLSRIGIIWSYSSVIRRRTEMKFGRYTLILGGCIRIDDRSPIFDLLCQSFLIMLISNQHKFLFFLFR